MKTKTEIKSKVKSKSKPKAKSKIRSGKAQHVVPLENDWAVRGENNKRRTKITFTKKAAINRARQIAKNKKSELIIHNRDGKISDKDSYGNDPHPPKDSKH